VEGKVVLARVFRQPPFSEDLVMHGDTIILGRENSRESLQIVRAFNRTGYKSIFTPNMTNKLTTKLRMLC
jgi:hypothetical protein